MINVSDIIVDMKAALDAEGSDYYTDAQDYIPAINRAMDHVVAIFNKAFSENKLSEENLRELIDIKLYQLSTTSTLTFDQVSLDAVWSILAVYPSPRTSPDPLTPAITPGATSQEYAGNNKFLGGVKSAKKRTLESWNDTENNPFEKGNMTITTGDLVEYSFLSFSTHLSFSTQETTYIILRPTPTDGVCGVAFLMYPPRVEDNADTVPFPSVMRNLVSSKALRYIAEKQGDNSTLLSVTDNDVKELTELLT